MFYKSLILLFLLTVLSTLCYSTATTDYFRSNGSGSWANAGTWQSSSDNSNWVPSTLAPTTAANTITIRSGNIVTVDATLSTDQTTVDAEGEIDVSSGITMTIANGSGTDMTVNGIFRNNAGTITTTGATLSFGSGGKYQHNYVTASGAIPLATWNAASTCEIIGYATWSNPPSNLGQSFGNFTWNCPSQNGNISAGGALTSIAGNLTIASTGASAKEFRLAATTSPTLNIGGNLILSGGTLNLSSGTGSPVINVAGYLMISNGILNMSSSSGSSTINLSGNYTMTGGNLTETGSGAANSFNFAGTIPQIISLTGTQIISNTINFTVNSSAIVQFETSSTVLGGSDGSFTAATTSTLMIKHPNGITASGTSGCIQTTGTRTFNVAANYTYNGNSMQYTGNGLPTAVNNLTINNIAGVTLSASCSVSGLILSTPLTIGSNVLSIAGSVSGTGGLIGGSTSNLSVSGSGSIVLPVISSGLNNFSVTRSNGVTLGCSVTVSGTFTFTSGTSLTLDVGIYTLTINGTARFNATNYITGAGSFILTSGATLQTSNSLGIIGGSSPQGSVQTVTRNFDTSANYTFSATSTNINTGGGLPSAVNNLTISGPYAVYLSTWACTVNGILTVTNSVFYVAGGQVLSVHGTAVFDATSTIYSLSSGSVFQLESGATLKTANVDGIRASGAYGSIQTTIRSYDTGANYTYNGTSAQTTGTGLPANVHDLTIINPAGVTLTYSCAVEGTFTLSSGNIDSNSKTLTINGTAIFNASNYVSGAGSFVLASGANLQTANPQGITSSGSGSVRTTTSTFSTSANYVYNGIATQVTGSSLPATVNNLTISNNAGISLSNSCSVSSVLTLTTPLTIGAYTLTIAGSISGTGGLVGGNSSNLSINGTGPIVIPSVISLNNLIINRTGVVSLVYSLSVNGSLILLTDLTIGAYSLTISGSIPTVIGGLISGSSSDLVIGGSGALILPAITSGLRNLSINRSGTVTLGSSLSISNTLTLTSDLSIGSNTLTINGTIPSSTGGLIGGSSSNIVIDGSTVMTMPSITSGLHDLTINRSGGVTLANSLSIGGELTLTNGTLAAGSFLNMATGSTVLRSNGLLTGTIQGSGIYSVVYTGTDKSTGYELTGSGLGNLTIHLDSGSTLTLDRSVTVDNDELLTFIQGSITLANYNLTINGSYAGTNQFIYNGTGILGGGNIGSNANVQISLSSPASIPAVVNTLEISPGSGNTITLPGDVTTTSLIFTNGSLAFNSHILSLAGKDFAVQGSNSISALNISMSPTSHTFSGYTSIPHTWQTNSIFNGTVDIFLTYPSSLSISPKMKVYNRNHSDGETNWNFIALLDSNDHDTYRSVHLTGITTLNGSAKGDLDWTLVEPDQDLPVELTSFTAISSTSQLLVTLQWTSGSETNNLGFNIIRSNNADLSNGVCLNANIIQGTNTSQNHTYHFSDLTVEASNTYYYWLENIDYSGISMYNGPVIVQVLEQENPDNPPVIPVEFTLLDKAYPNPFNPETNISFQLKTPSFVNITIYDIKGQKIQTLTSRNWELGRHNLVWCGTDEKGNAVSSGIYFYRMIAGKYSSTKKVVLVK